MVTRQQIEYDATYHPILAACILGPFRSATAIVGNNGGGVHNVILDPRDNGVGLRDIMGNGWDDWNCFCCECLLGRGI